MSFSELEFRNKAKKVRKEVFFEKMEKIVPLKDWCDLIRPYYYENGNGRQPKELGIMLKMYLVSVWFNLSDPETEDMCNDSMSVRNYVGIKGAAPDETTLCRFRHILEQNGLTEKIFDSFKAKLEREHVILHEGTIVDATIIEAPTSKKNKSHQRTPEMGATRKNNTSHYGSKAHIGIDKDSKIVHSVTVTPANINDIDEVGKLVHGEEKEVYADAGYTGIECKSGICEKFQDGSGEVEWKSNKHKENKRKLVCKIRKDVTFRINRKRQKVTTAEEREEERNKTAIRIHIEHIFATIKERFGCRKIVYRALNKVRAKLLMVFTLVNVLTYARMKLYTK